MGTQAPARTIAPSPPSGAERAGVRWGIPECSLMPTSPSHAYGAGPSLSPLKGGEGFANARQCRYVDALIAALAALAICCTARGARAQSPGNFSTLSTTGGGTLGRDVLLC